MLVPSNAMVQIPIKQLTLGKSGYELLNPGVVKPVDNRGAPLAGFEWPDATKYGNEPKWIYI